MTITLTLPPATEERLRALAAAKGSDLPTVILEAVETRLATSPLTFRQLLAPVHDEVRRGGTSDDELNQLLADELAAARVERRQSPRKET